MLFDLLCLDVYIIAHNEFYVHSGCDFQIKGSDLINASWYNIVPEDFPDYADVTAAATLIDDYEERKLYRFCLSRVR